MGFNPWRTSTRCASGNCVEIRLFFDSGHIGIRDSKQKSLGAEQPMLTLKSTAFDHFASTISAESPKGLVDDIEISRRHDGWTVFHSIETGVELHFDDLEIDAFVAGIKAGEFTPEALMQPVG